MQVTALRTGHADAKPVLEQLHSLTGESPTAYLGELALL